jgi:hypothetical protein
MNVSNTSTNTTLQTAIAEALAVPSTPSMPLPGRAKVAIRFLTQDRDAALAIASGRILVAMTGNAHYPAPLPAMADVAAARNAFLAAMNAAKSGTPGVITRRQLRNQLVVLLRALALYVQQACNGDTVVLLGSGYPAQRTRQPAGQLPAPVNLRLARGLITGQLKARSNRVAQAGSYQWRYATAAAPTVWTFVNPTLGARVAINGLVPGTEYIVQGRAVGSQGPSDWSDAASLMVV